VCDWAVAEGWNMGLGDAEPFHAADPDGFLIGTLDGVPAGSISAVRYGADYGFLGLFIVRPELRGRGYGRMIWQAAEARLAGRTVGLDAVTEEVANYTQQGFAAHYRSVRHECLSAHIGDIPHYIKPVSRLPFEKLLAFDRRYFPAERRSFLDRWVHTPGAHALASVIDGQMQGFGMVRPCHRGWKTGPLHATSPGAARELFEALVSSLPEGSTVFLDSPEANPAAIKLAHDMAMKPVFETIRMYKGRPPAFDVKGVYSVTSFELG
jgi:GNAT superfamily N-acetyltransferase